MRVGLFIPCYIDQFYPQVGKAVYRFLKKLNLDLEYPMDQTCCGQPLANSGMRKESEKYAVKFWKLFSGFDYVVCPSASCVLHVREHFPDLPEDGMEGSFRGKTLEFVEFIHDILRLEKIEASFPHKVALIHGCHGLRGLRLESSSELNVSYFSKNMELLRQVRGIRMVTYDREDECCGFGGSFSVFEETVSVRMGLDKLKSLTACGAEYVTGNDMSCLMHLEGLSHRQHLGLKFIHIAEILNGAV
ncbi:MAG: (Fe-S)-binding protein [Cyclobacteriaceae bacterium]|nr:(Fe-S)-binding protein [Cyclobacteriaceae bacterium]